MPLASNAIISIEEASAYIKVDSSDDNDLIESIINAVSNLFEKYCQNYFVTRALTQVYDGNGLDKLILRNYPVTVFTAITIRDYPVQVVTDYYVDYDAGILKAQYITFPDDFQNIEVQYSSGLAALKVNLPDDLKLAAKKQVEFFYKRDSSDFSDTFAEGMIIRAPAELLTPTVKGMLEPYKNERV